MRRIRTVGLGFAFALATQTGSAQELVRAVGVQPATPPASAATLGRISAAPAPDPVGISVRGQAPMPTQMPSVMPTAMPVAGSGLGAPRPAGPTVTEVRTPEGTPAPGTAPAPGTSAAPATGVPFAAPSVLPYSMPAAVGGGVALDDPLFAGANTLPGGGVATHNRWQVSADYLLWFTKSYGIPPLVTTSLPASNGILGMPDTGVVVGNRSFTDTLHSGGRFSATYWMGQRELWGLDGNIFFLGRNGASVTANSATYPVLARPFVNLNQGIQFSELVASPGLAVGAANVNMDTSLWGAEMNVRRYIASTCCARLDWLAGFRYMELNDDLKITESFIRSPGSAMTPGVPNILYGTVQDQIRTENQFYGGQVGLVGEIRRGRWFANARGTVGIGTVFQTVEIGGSQSLMFDTGPAAAAGGLLALPGANIGRFSQHKFAVMPEIGLQVGYHVTQHVRLAVGYNFLYLSSVLRPGDQIDPGLDVTRIPNFPLNPSPAPLGVVRPNVPMKETDFFAQGISFSIQFTW